ncbi:MAG: TauD/TfdA family dioxygenase [Gammaproteobacteria bacterium]|nr:TauD/TfdA family dioxygenase [Gammaproteobacteria bacterium]MDH5652336.1 TauD/TfdA family dioxygenase [Gammaproteobacteria bacterium]
MHAPDVNSHSLYQSSPFLLENIAQYTRWREQKLTGYPTETAQLVVEVQDATALTDEEYQALLNLCCKTNMAVYRITAGDISSKQVVRALGRRFGLERLDNNLCADEDAITTLQVMNSGRHTAYIPYTNRPISWHSDGYYNKPEEQIRGMILHCVRNAAQGGDNLLLDHEIAYLHLRDTNPDYITALMHPRAMTIPPNNEGGEEIRAAQSGPVFSIDSQGNLHMRYTARTRSIVWREDKLTSEAVACMKAFMEDDSNPWIFRHRLQPGEGYLGNNVLHNRLAFADSEQQQRLLYRARYFDRIAHTDVMQCATDSAA